MNRRRRNQLKQKDRKGAAAVEFALLLPLLCTITLGMMEIGRGTMVSTIMYNAATNGAQVAAVPGATSSTVTTRINSVLTANNINTANATISILVNGVAADASTAVGNDKITVSVSIPASQTSLTSFSTSLLKNTTFTGTLTVMRMN
jgi:Flp pilus assembly protein TadG